MYLHFSVDDTFHLLTELKKDRFPSLFDHPIWAFFREMHEQFGALFSFYCFDSIPKENLCLSSVSKDYAEEFSACADWLKFGFHAAHPDCSYGPCMFPGREIRSSAGIAKENYSRVISTLLQITGSANSIDRVPRIHYYAGSSEALTAWKNCAYGISGLLSSEDLRVCYQHTPDQYQALIDFGLTQDDSLSYYRTAFRLENTADPVAAMQSYASSSVKNPLMIIFTHEPYLYDAAMRQKIRSCCEEANRLGLTYAYAQDLFFPPK